MHCIFPVKVSEIIGSEIRDSCLLSGILEPGNFIFYSKIYSTTNIQWLTQNNYHDTIISLKVVGILTGIKLNIPFTRSSRYGD